MVDIPPLAVVTLCLMLRRSARTRSLCSSRWTGILFAFAALWLTWAVLTRPHASRSMHTAAVAEAGEFSNMNVLWDVTPVNTSTSLARRMPGWFDRSLLVVLTVSAVPGPGPRITRLRAIRDTWGQRCRVAILTMDREHDLAALGGEHELGDGPVELWQLPNQDKKRGVKQARAMRYALTRAASQPDVQWVFWANDHTFVVVQNLVCLLRDYDAQELHYLGHRLNGPCCGNFNSGGAGFALSRGVLDRLTAQWAPGANKMDDCWGDNTQIAKCLRTLLLPEGYSGPSSTRDDAGGERFHVYGPLRMASGTIDNWLVHKKKALGEQILRGPACCARDTVSFHYVAAREARVLDEALQLPPQQRARRSAQTWRSAWPSHNEVGGYSVGWPRNVLSESAVVEFLGHKLQVLDPAAGCTVPSMLPPPFLNMGKCHTVEDCEWLASWQAAKAQALLFNHNHTAG